MCPLPLATLLMETPYTVLGFSADIPNLIVSRRVAVNNGGNNNRISTSKSLIPLVSKASSIKRAFVSRVFTEQLFSDSKRQIKILFSWNKQVKSYFSEFTCFYFGSESPFAGKT